MTAPEDPFRTPAPGSTPDGGDGARSGGYGSGSSGGPSYEPPSAPPPSYDGQQRPGEGGGQDPYGAQGQPPTSQQYGSPPQYGSPQYGGQQHGGQQYGAAPYGTQPYGSSHPSGPKRNGFGVAALVLGILALLTGLFFVGALFGVAAIVFGVLGRGRVKRGEADNGGMAIAGIVLGVLGLLLTALAVVGTVTFLNSEEFGSLNECLQSAGNDQAAQQQCADDFSDQIGG